MTLNILWVLIILNGLWMTCVANANDKPNQTDAEFLKSYAERMKSYMNLSISPCDDFYEYTCGNWKNVAPDRQSGQKASSLGDIQFILGDIVEKLLTKTSLAIDLGYEAELQIAQQFYNACLTANLQPLPAADPAYLSLIKSIGGFPAVEGATWQANRFSWCNMSAHLSNYGASGLIKEDIAQLYPFFPYFKQPALLGFDFMVNSDNLATNETRAYKLNEQRMRGYLQAFGLNEEKVKETIDGVFAFWRDVLDLNSRKYVDRNSIYCESKSSGTFKQWSNYYEIAWNGQNFSMEPYIVFCPTYYDELDKVCSKHGPSVANYLAMKLLYIMDAKFKDVKYQKRYCRRTVQVSLPILLDKLFSLEYFSEETRTEIQSILNELRKSLRVALTNAKWLDIETRREALKKEFNIESIIGSYQDDQLSHRLIREMNNLSFVDGNYAQNNINLKRFGVYMKRFNGIHHKELSNETKFIDDMLDLQANAYYSPIDNTVLVLSGILHPPAYHQSWPHSMKFGKIGSLMGHELTHAFELNGAEVDSQGNERNWLSDKSKEVLIERIQCLVEHYDNYLIREINRTVDGNKTKNENIADSVGLRIALSAYRSFKGEQLTAGANKSEQMPGLDHSPEQLFFLGFAQQFCAFYREEDYWQALNQEHSPEKYRVLGTVSNSEDFAKAYNCPLGSPMNLKAEKCRVW